MTALGPISGRLGSATPPAGTRRKRTCGTNEKLAANSLYYSCRFALDHSRLVEIVGHRRSRGPALEHRQFRDLGVEVDDVGRSAFPFPLRLAASPRVVDITLVMLARKGRQAEMSIALGMAAVPCALRNDGDHSSAE